MMYTGTLIEDLLQTVERAEKRTLQARSADEKLTHFYAVSHELTQLEPALAGVA